MQATSLAISLLGLDAQLVRVEVDSGRGPAGFQLVGLAEASVRESRVRVRAALAQAGIELDEFVLTVNLAPADLKKSGGAYDLAIAMATLAALGKIPPEEVQSTLFLGELSLAGAIRSVRGVLPALRGAAARRIPRAIVPFGNAAEAASVPAIDVRVAKTLDEVIQYFKRGKALMSPSKPERTTQRAELAVDLAEVRGQHAARRALEIAAAGGHNLLMMGPPGSGKTMLARRLPTILPPLSPEEALEVTAIHSVAGLLPADKGLVTERPFRAPHHTVSAAGLVGGGEPVRPGEVSLAHQGCLFLDELLEFKRNVLEALRQPLEDGTVTIARARTRAWFPARPVLVAAVNPCPCGFAGDRNKRCTCSVERMRQYRGRLSGPLLDRIDLQIVLPPVVVAALKGVSVGESSESVRERVLRGRAMQAERRGMGDVKAASNAELLPRELDRVARPDEAGERLLAAAVDRLGLSARAYGKVLRVARTIADLEGATSVRAAHVAEAIQARLLDRELSSSELAAS